MTTRCWSSGSARRSTLSFGGAPVRTNLDGHPDKQYPAVPSANTVRILGIGDSVMFGWGVAPERNYLSILERRLEADFPQHNWEVLNAAVPGYNTVMEVELLTQVAPDFQPDLVLLGFIPNDLVLPAFLHRRPSHGQLDPSLSARRDSAIREGELASGGTVGGGTRLRSAGRRPGVFESCPPTPGVVSKVRSAGSSSYYPPKLTLWRGKHSGRFPPSTCGGRPKVSRVKNSGSPRKMVTPASLPTPSLRKGSTHS